MSNDPDAARRPPAHVELGDPLVVDGSPVPARLAHLLRLLLEAEGRAVSAAVLQDALWPALEVADPAAALHALVSRTRRLGIEVERFGSGYRIPRDAVRVTDPDRPAEPADGTGAGVGARPIPDALPAGWRYLRGEFVGREEDAGAALDALDASRLVTIMGTGGVGKTTLAAEVLRRRRERARSGGSPVAGVAVTELATITGADDAVTAILSAAGAPEHTSPSGRTRPLPLTRDQRVAALQAAAPLERLVVIDNCEHLTEAVSGIVDELLDATSHLRFLATSRSPLGLRGEHIRWLGPLAVAQACDLFDRLSREAGIARLAPAQDPAVRTLVQRLDSLPLAIELAAARSRSHGVPEILRALEAGAAVDAGALRGLPDRHASLWTLVDWSWRLLEEPQRELLAALSVTRGTVDLPLAARLIDGSEATAWPVMTALVDSSLLYRTDDGWRLLETVREYAQARLRSADPAIGLTEQEVLDRLSSWAQDVARAAAPRLFGPAQVPTAQMLARHRESLLLAAEHSLTASWPVRAALGLAAVIASTFADIADLELQLAPPAPVSVTAQDEVITGSILTITFAFEGRLRAAARAWRHTATALRRADAADVPERLRDLSLLTRASLVARDDRPPAELETFLRSADPLVRGLTRIMQVSLTTDPARQADGFAQLRLAYDEVALAGDEWAMATSATALAQHLIEHGEDPAAAMRWWSTSERHFEALNSHADITTTRLMRDIAAAVDGDDEATGRLERHADLPRGDIGLPYALFGLGLRIGLRAGDWATAAEHLRRALTEARAVEGVTPHTNAVLAAAAGAAAARADLEGAHELLSEARHALRNVTDSYVLGTVCLAWGLWCTRPAAAEDGEENGNPPPVADELLALGRRLGGNLSIMLPQDRLDHTLHLVPSAPAIDRAGALTPRQATARARRLLNTLP